MINCDIWNLDIVRTSLMISEPWIANNTLHKTTDQSLAFSNVYDKRRIKNENCIHFCWFLFRPWQTWGHSETSCQLTRLYLNLSLLCLLLVTTFSNFKSKLSTRRSSQYSIGWVKYEILNILTIWYKNSMLHSESTVCTII